MEMRVVLPCDLTLVIVTGKFLFSMFVTLCRFSLWNFFCVLFVLLKGSHVSQIHNTVMRLEW